MKLKNLLLFAVSASLVSATWVFNRSLSLQNSASDERKEMEEEEHRAESIQGAIESFYSMRLNEKTQTLEPEWVQAALQQANALRVTARASSILWNSMGPDNVGGRIRAFLMHKDSLSLMFASGVSGGLWRSSTQGQSWYPVNDMQENLNVTCIAQTADGSIYYGTGEGGFTNLSGNKPGSPAFLGNGIYKSTNNRGVAFTHLTSSNGSQFQQCNAMVAHPTEDKLWVATDAGIYVTTNGGGSFTLAKSGSFKDMVIASDGTVWATNSSGGVFKTNNGTFTTTAINSAANGFPPSGGRTSIAVSKQDPNYVYTLSGRSNSRMEAIRQSKNAGATWDTIVNSTSVTDVLTGGAGGQGWYDNVIAVDPENKERIYVGGIVLATWDNVGGFREIANTSDNLANTGYVHADKHIIQFDTRTKPTTMIVGTDGGLFFSQNRTQWTRRNRNLTTFQAYNVAANAYGYVMGGGQDNGTQLINFSGNSTNGQPSRTAFEIYGGDGFDVEFSHTFPKTIFASTYYGEVARSSNLGQTIGRFWDTRIKPNTADANPARTDFNTTFNLWERDADSSSLLFLARNSEVWVAVNPTNFAHEVVWFLIANGLGSDRIMEMDYTPDGDHLFVCKFGQLIRIDNIQSANFDPTVYPNPATIPSPIAKFNITPAVLTSRVITSVNVDQADGNHVVLTLGGYGNTTFVYETKNALSPVVIWNNITGNLPQMPVYDAVIDIDNPAHIILGTDLGVWETTNGGTGWVEANNGMARVPIYEIRGYEFHPWEGMALYIGTHGRGFYNSVSLMSNTKKITRESIKLNAFPNPAVDQVNIQFNLPKSGAFTLEIIGLNGQQHAVVKRNGNAGENTVPMNISTLAKGYYFARITTNGVSNTVKFVVNN